MCPYQMIKEKATLAQLEYERGKSDAKRDFPPAVFAGPYVEGYCSVIKPSYWKSFRD